MRGPEKQTLVSLLFLSAAMQVSTSAFAQTQTIAFSDGAGARAVAVATVCAHTPTQKALQLICLREPAAIAHAEPNKTIVIGFVGGFVNHDDAKHSEVQFAQYLRERYPSSVEAEVYTNHAGKQALQRVVQLLDIDRDGVLSTTEKKQARIIIYGHSWGASQAATLARELGKLDIPVLLTAQIDSIRKLGQQTAMISANVGRAVNFYQERGMFHGRRLIHADNPDRTAILGNYRMNCEDHRFGCEKPGWIRSFFFNKPHLEIENDPWVWNQIALLIDAEVSGKTAEQTATSTHEIVMR